MIIEGIIQPGNLTRQPIQNQSTRCWIYRWVPPRVHTKALLTPSGQITTRSGMLWPKARMGPSGSLIDMRMPKTWSMASWEPSGRSDSRCRMKRGSIAGMVLPCGQREGGFKWHAYGVSFCPEIGQKGLQDHECVRLKEAICRDSQKQVGCLDPMEAAQQAALKTSWIQ
jgi:hypothetical protein